MNGIYEEFRIAVHNVWQRRWMVLVIAWVISVLGWLFIAFIPNSYESQARVFVDMRTILPDAGGVEAQARERDVEDVEQTLTSAINLEKVIRSIDTNQSAISDKEMQGRVAGLRNNIKVISDRDNLFEISAVSSSSGLSDGENAAMAKNIVQKLIDIFIEENLAGGRGETKASLKFYDEQLALRQKELEEAERKRAAFEADNLGFLPGVGSISERTEAARRELSQLTTQLSSSQAALAAINAQLAGTPATISTPGFSGANIGGARGALSAARGRLAALRARGLTDAHPDILSLQAEIATLSAQAASEPGGGSFGAPNPAYSSLLSIKAERQANVAALSARKRALESDVATMTAKQIAEPEVAAEQARISRDYEVLKDQYDKLLADRETVRLRGQVETETDAVQFRVIDPPTAPTAPVAPNRPLLLAGILFVGIAGGIGGAFAHSQMRPSYATPERLQKAAGLPVLGAISQTLTESQRVLRNQRMRWFAGGVAGLGGIFLILLLVEMLQRGSVA